MASGEGKVGRRYWVKRQKWREGASRFLSRAAQDHSHVPHGWQKEACPLATPASPGRLISASSHALEFSTFCDKGTSENDPVSLMNGETEVQRGREGGS